MDVAGICGKGWVRFRQTPERVDGPNLPLSVTLSFKDGAHVNDGAATPDAGLN
jgi:hypothetical protein